MAISALFARMRALVLVPGDASEATFGKPGKMNACGVRAYHFRPLIGAGRRELPSDWASMTIVSRRPLDERLTRQRRSTLFLVDFLLTGNHRCTARAA